MEENIDEDIEVKNKDGNISITLTTTDNQKNEEKNKNKTTINLGQCEYELKTCNNISINDSLFIIKTDIKKEGIDIPKIEYEIYYPSYGKLDLGICKDTKIDISIPVKLKDDLEKYNPESDYYNDICSKTTSIYGTDISLEDRQKIFAYNNMFLCEENCKLIDYDYINEKSKCSCDIKTKSSDIEDVKFNKDTFYNSFKDVKNMVNLNLMKCSSTIFLSGNIKLNYGFFIFGSIILLFLTGLILFYCKLSSFINNIDNILSSYNNDTTINKTNKKSKKVSHKKKKKGAEKGINLKENDIKNFPPKKSSLKKRKNIMKIINNINNVSIDKKIELGSHHIIKELNPASVILSKVTKTKDKTNLIYNDRELNSLSYKKALKIDKRTYIQYYLSLLKTNHLFLFTFINKTDHNSRIIKILLFFFYFSVHFTVNALFFNDKTMHKILEDEGKYNFIYQIPQIIYSSLISIFINAFVKFFALSERSILKLKNRKKNNNFESKKKRLFFILKIKFALFFVISFIFLLVFSYYVICFCGVYINTQTHLIKDSVISFGISLLYPFGIYLLPGIFRIFALKNKKKDRSIIYKISKILQMF